MTPGRHAAPDGSFRRSAGAAAGRGIILLGVAVILGIVLLSATDAQPPGEQVTAGRQGEAPDDQGDDGQQGDDPDEGATTLPPPTTAPARQPRDIKVIVVNASGARGAAARITDQLRPVGYNLLAPTNATPLVNESAVFHAAGLEREAAGVASAIGIAPTAVRLTPTPPPVADTKGAEVVVLIGRDVAARLGPAPTSTTARATTTTARARTTSTTAANTTTTTTGQ